MLKDRLRKILEDFSKELDSDGNEYERAIEKIIKLFELWRGV